MPTYSYECKKCSQVDDVYHAMSAKPRVACSACGSTAMKKLLGTGAGIIFKGSGFYETDYKNGGKKAGKSGDSKSESKSESKSDGGGESKAKSADSAGASKTEPKSTPPASKATSAA